MSEQNTHTTNDTVDPQFLGPKAGQQAGGDGEPSYGMTATYSPDDNKLRITSASRLDRATYDRVKGSRVSLGAEAGAIHRADVDVDADRKLSHL